MVKPVYPYILYLEGEKYFLKPLPRHRGEEPSPDFLSVVSTDGFVDYYLDQGKLKKTRLYSSSDIEPYFVGDIRFGAPPRRLGYAVDPKKNEVLGWIVVNHFGDYPLDNVPPYLKIIDVDQREKSLVVSGGIEPGAKFTMTIETSDGDQTKTIENNKVTFSLPLILTGNERKIILGTQDLSGNKTEVVLKVNETQVSRKEEWENKQEEYLTMLAKFAALGYPFEFEPGLHFSHGNTVEEITRRTFESVLLSYLSSAWWRYFEKNIGPATRKVFSLGESPLEVLKDRFEPDLLVDASLRKNKRIQTNPLTIHFETIPNGKRIRLINFMDGKTLAEVSFKHPKDTKFLDHPDSEASLASYNRLESALYSSYDQFLKEGWTQNPDAKIRDILKKRGEVHQPSPIFRLYTEEKIASEALGEWREWLTKFPEGLTIGVFPDRGKLDQMIGKQTGIVELNLSLDSLKSHPILAQGNVKTLTFGLTLLQYLWEVIGPLPDAEAKIEKEKMRIENRFDQYKNHITAISHGDKLVGLSIERPPNLETSPNGDVRPVKIDLSQFGGKDLPPIIWERVKYPIGQLGGLYHIYSDFEEEKLEAIKPYFENISQMAIASEVDFGLTPGTAIKNIYLVNSQKENASVRTHYPETIWIWSEMVPSFKKGQNPTTHEAVHVIDNTYIISAQDPFKTFFDETQKKAGKKNGAAKHFFALANDRNFLAREMGGHALDSPSEALASLLLGFRDFEESAIQEKFEDMPRELRLLFAEAYKAAAHSIETKLPKAPLVTRLKRAVKILEE